MYYFLAFALWMAAIVALSFGLVWTAIIWAAIGIYLFIKGAIREEKGYAD